MGYLLQDVTTTNQPGGQSEHSETTEIGFRRSTKQA